VLVPFKSMPRYVNFRYVDAWSTPAPQTVTLRRGDGGPLKLEIAQIGNPGINAVLNEIVPGEQYELVVGLAPPIHAGKLRSWVRLNTGVKDLKTKTVPVYADIPRAWQDMGE
jgi:hypothetical protein